MSAERQGWTPDAKTVSHVTAVCRKVDPEFEKEGGGTRHWVRDFFLPALAEAGYVVVSARLSEERVETAAGAIRRVMHPSSPERDCTECTDAAHAVAREWGFVAESEGGEGGG